MYLKMTSELRQHLQDGGQWHLACLPFLFVQKARYVLHALEVAEQHGLAEVELEARAAYRTVTDGSFRFWRWIVGITAALLFFSLAAHCQSPNVKPCLANAVAPTFTEASANFLSCDLAGNLRTSAGVAGGTNITQLNSVNLGSPSNFGTSPGAVSVFGMNASVLQWGGSALGAMANYGTSPGAVLVPGVNAFVTNIPAVTQSSGPWTQNLTQVNSVALGSPSNFGTAPAAIAVIGANVALTQVNTTGVANGLGTCSANGGCQRVAVASDSQIRILGNAGSTLDSAVGVGTAPANALMTSQIFNATALAPTTGQAMAVQADAAGSTQVNPEVRKASYRAALTNTLWAAGVSGSFFGSATKTIRVTRIIITTSSTAVLNSIVINKRSTADSVGTCTTLTQVPLDSNFAAGTATLVKSCTAVETTGTLVGAIANRRFISGNATAPIGHENPVTEFDFGPPYGASELVLRGTAQGVDFTLLAAATVDLEIEWTEE